MAHKTPYNVLRARPMVAGAIHTKDGGGSDDQTAAEGIERLSTELGNAVSKMDEATKSYEKDSRILIELKKSVEGLKDVPSDTKAQLDDLAKSVGEHLTTIQAMQQGMDAIKKEMDSPIYQGGSVLAEKDRMSAIELQKRAFIVKGGSEDEFVEDLDNLVDAKDYRSAVRKLMKVGLESKDRIQRSFTENERKAFDAASLDAGFFSPELLGITIDCEIECASLLDLYQQITVNRSSFMFPHIQSYGDIGKYDCDAKCDAEYGPEGNITWKNNNTSDWRGVFCLQRDTLHEANFDFLNFMFTTAARSHRISRNAASIVGDGVNEPMGWLTADVFAKVETPAANPTHVDLRGFLASHPREYGDVTATMHQNIFAYFARMVDANGRFLFGDGMMGFSPDDVRDRIRISNCLPDATNDNTLGGDTPFTAGDFIMAAGNWDQAYASISQRPLWMEQWEGGSSAWCVKYQLGAKDGGMVTCAGAARTLIAGAGVPPAP